MFTQTTTQLLDSLKCPSNDGLWRQFDDRYRPILIAFARSQGATEEDAAEAAQLTLAQFAADYRAGGYDRSRGRLSSFIVSIARHRLIDMARARQRRHISRGDSAIIELPDERTMTEAWETARRRVIFERALHVLRTDTRLDPRTIRAFELCALRNTPAEAAAAECGMTVPEVYVAKNRAIKKLREIVAQFTQEFDED
ncbi:MAG: RNA polymerase sigma factor [Phycisphaerales bacterium]